MKNKELSILLDKKVFEYANQNEFIPIAFDLIKKGAEPDIKSYKKKSEELTKVQKQNIQIAVFFYNNKSESLVNTLYLALNEKKIANNHKEIAKFLNDKSENTLLNQVCKMRFKTNSVELAKILLENGAGVNKKDEEGNIPIYYSCLKGDRKLTKLLIKNKANINFVTKVINKEGVTTDCFLLTTFAYKQGESKITKLLINYQSDPVKSSILNQACQNKDASMIKYIVQNIFDHKKEEEAKIQFFLDCMMWLH